jgi:hypothetical protein
MSAQGDSPPRKARREAARQGVWDAGILFAACLEGMGTARNSVRLVRALLDLACPTAFKPSRKEVNRLLLALEEESPMMTMHESGIALSNKVREWLDEL